MADKRRYPEQICPICELEQPDREPLAYFAGIGVGPVTAEGIESAFDETSRLIAFLAAAVHRAKALFEGIWAIANGGLGKDTLSHIIDLASPGEAILEDQLTKDNKEDPLEGAEV